MFAVGVTALIAPRAGAQDHILLPEQTVELEHEDRMARLRAAVDSLGLHLPPRFSVVRVPAERMPQNFRVSVPVLRVAFSERTFFDTARAMVLPTGLQAVAAVAEAARGEAPDAAIFVAGHTDSRGGEAYNQNLSVLRANAVSDALHAFGVGEAALWRVGFGEAAPLYANDTDEHMAFNRRVEFLFGARVEPVVEVLSRQRETNVCIADSAAESRRCLLELPRQAVFEATQKTRRRIGVGLDGRVAGVGTASPRSGRVAARRPGEIAAAVPTRIAIPLIQARSIPAPRR